MLKRLIIAVFVLGLVLALNGTAVSDVGRGELNPVIKVNPTNQRFVDIADARPQQPTFRKPDNALKELPPGLTAPTPPASYFCDVQDYTSGSPYYYWPIPDAYGDDLRNMRFTSDAGYDCTTMVAHYLMYGSVMTGTPDMRCYIWDDDGFGFPGNKLDSVDIPYASLPTSGLGYVSVDFTPAGNSSGLWWVFSDGEEYHKGWTTLQSGPGDTLAIISDAADGPYVGEERSSEYWAGMWGTILNNWGIDVSFFILNERCCSEIPYSDCYTQSYWQNIAYFWRAPHPVWGDSAYAQRFSVGGPETLMTVDLMVYDPSDGSFGNDTVYVTVYADDGAGLPGALIQAVALDPGTYPAFPSWSTADFTAYNLVFESDFHIAFSSSGAAGVDYESCLSSDGSDGVGRSSSNFDPGGGFVWMGMLSGWGVDVNFMIDANMCKDEYYTCSWNWCYAGLAYFWRLPDRYGDYAHAAKFKAGGFQECRVQDVCWALYDNGEPNIYTTQSKVSVYTDASGLPGTELASILIGPGTGNPYVLFPAMMCVDFNPLNVQVSGDYWVAIEALTADTLLGIRTLSDAGGGTCTDSWAEFWGAWSTMCTYWGVGCDWNVIVDVYHCCIEYTGRVCVPSEDWPTLQHDYARTGASNNPVSDAWCDLTVNWNYEHPTQSITFTGPVVFGNWVVCSFTDQYKVFDLITGTPIYTLSGFPIGGSVRCAPTIDVVGTDTLMFVSGGDQNSIMAYNFNTGALVWSRDIVTVGPGGLFGQTRWGVFTLLNDVLYWGTDDGYVVAALAATGQRFTGWGDTTVAGNNPVSLSLSTYVSGATDGTSLFYTTYSTGAQGDLYSIDAATGAINWQLSATGPLQGATVWGAAISGPEGFTGGVSYANGVLYANSRGEGDYPVDGVFYRIASGSGSVLSAVIANRVWYGTPIIDANRLYQMSVTRWLGPPAGGDLYGVSKNTGNIVWAVPTADDGRGMVQAVLTCEPEPEDDYIFVGNISGFLGMYASADGDELYRRRVDHGVGGGSANYVFSGCISHDSLAETHVTFGTFWGDLIDMTKQADRPRLEIQTYNPVAPVEFGPAPSLIVNIDDVFVNTGCAELVFDSICVDEIFADCCDNKDTPGFVSGVDPSFLDRADKIADKIARDVYLSKFLRPNRNVVVDDENSILSVREMEFGKERINRAAAGFPPYLNSVVYPNAGSILNAGDTADLVLDVIQSAISRGPQIFYLNLWSNDPDFHLNPSFINEGPCLTVALIGGCLLDTTTLDFGVGSANYQLVSNTGRITSDDWSPSYGIDIDGDDDAMWAAMYWHGVSQHRLAMDLHNPGAGALEGWYSWQADPNWCDNDCKPHLSDSICLGPEYSVDGNSYTALTTNEVCASGVDSVQNYDLGAGWDWENFGAPFDNDSTMGLYVRSLTIGVVDHPGPLASMTLEVFEFTERNSQDILNWKFGAWCDYDVGAMAGDKDTMYIDRSISTVWNTAHTPGAIDAAWGFIKVPFGCGTGADHTPLKNVVTLDSDNSMYGANAGDYFDSTYYYASLPPGEYSMPNAVSQRDQSMHATLIEKDTIHADESFSFGIAVFGLHGMTDPQDPAELAPLAHLVNKFAGWGRGDVNNDNVINLGDVIYLAATVNGGPGAIPFKHLSDVNADGNIDILDVDYLVNFYFNCGPCPMGDWICSP